MTTSRKMGAVFKLLCAAFVLSLTGCAGTRLIDSEVQSFVGTTAPPATGTFRFERLPSQSANAQHRERLETLTTDALKKVGLQRDDAQAQMSVQVDLQVQQYVRTPPLSSRMGRLVMTPDGTLWQPVAFHMLESTWTRHRINLVMRDIASNQIALETSAEFDGPWSDTLQLLPAILDAALQGYPAPPAGVRKVVIPLSPPDAGKQ